MNWRRITEGAYIGSDGDYNAVVSLEGEYWVSQVTYRGRVIDVGEWDGRIGALRSAEGAVKRGRQNRNPIAVVVGMRNEDADMVDEDPEDDGDA